jgi:hypothetical protein
MCISEHHVGLETADGRTPVYQAIMSPLSGNISPCTDKNINRSTVKNIFLAINIFLVLYADKCTVLNNVIEMEGGAFLLIYQLDAPCERWGTCWVTT